MAEESPTPGASSHSIRERPLGKSVVQAERLTQIALVLPIAVLIGWFFGSLLDRWFHQSWITVVGLILGMIAGMLEAVRMALGAGNTGKK